MARLRNIAYLHKRTFIARVVVSATALPAFRVGRRRIICIHVFVDRYTRRATHNREAIASKTSVSARSHAHALDRNRRETMPRFEDARRHVGNVLARFPRREFARQKIECS